MPRPAVLVRSRQVAGRNMTERDLARRNELTLLRPVLTDPAATVLRQPRAFSSDLVRDPPKEACTAPYRGGMQRNHDGRVYLITGATSGLGRDVAAHLRNEGASVFGIGTSDAGITAAIAEGALTAGRACDVTDAAAVESVVAAAITQLGRLDGAFVNAGIDGDGLPALDADPTHFLRVLDVNVRGAFISARTVAKHLLATPGDGPAGSIVINASVNGLRPEPNFASYNASKAAAITLARTFALEWAPRVAVTAIAPGYFPSRMTKPYLDDPDTASELRAMIPAARFGTPAELGSLVSLLLSPDGAFLTGGCITIDGGRSI